LSNYSYPSEIKRVLKPAHKELEERGFLARVSCEGKTEVTYEVSAEFARRQKARELSGDPGELFVIERLVSEGLRGDVARDLVARHGSERCLRYTDALESQRGIRSRAGWLRRAIEHGYELPNTPPLPDISVGASSPPRRADRNSADRAPIAKDPYYVSNENIELDRRAAPPVTDPDAQAVWGPLLTELTEDMNAPSSKVWFDGVVPLQR
jgi:hypothetical protein